MSADPATAPSGHLAAISDRHHGLPVSPKPAWRLLVGVAAAVVAIDQATKAAIVATMAVGDTIPVVPTIDLHHTTNRGIAFGFLPGFGDIHLPVAFVVVAILLAVYRTLGPGATWMRVALALQVGGAIGNIVDRLRIGAVTDFVSFHVDAIGFRFAVFNVADAAISVGSLVLVGAVLARRHE